MRHDHHHQEKGRPYLREAHQRAQQRGGAYRAGTWAAWGIVGVFALTMLCGRPLAQGTLFMSPDTSMSRVLLGDVQRCVTEDGSSPTGTYPCLWDAARQGNHMGTPVLYVDSIDGGCLPALPAFVRCLDVADIRGS